MKIALIGYGKMGHAIESLALEKGHSIVCTIDNPDEMEQKKPLLSSADVAIEFTTPKTASANLRLCIELGVPVVCGTTGWYADYYDIADLCNKKKGALLASSNFSIGMNIMFAINEKLAMLMDSHPEYSVDISETHHIHKLDAPSGTAITLRQQIAAVSHGNRSIPENIPIESIREGEIAGIHTVRYNSEIDTLTITHEAHSRKGLALGALMAAEFLAGKQGVFTMKDIL